MNTTAALSRFWRNSPPPKATNTAPTNAHFFLALNIQPKAAVASAPASF
jgi:hypothetical protein